jgi:hypothetical protein
MVSPVVNEAEPSMGARLSNVIVVNPAAVAFCHAVASLYVTTVAKPGAIESANKAQDRRADLRQSIFFPLMFWVLTGTVRGEKRGGRANPSSDYSLKPDSRRRGAMFSKNFQETDMPKRRCKAYVCRG